MKRSSFLKTVLAASFSVVMFNGAQVAAQTAAKSNVAPEAIKLGALNAGSGAFSVVSNALSAGLNIWVKSQNDKGGVYVKAYDKRIPIKVISYNDQSSPMLATNFYSRLVTEDKVDILVSDYTTVLTAPAVPIAKENKILLFNPAGTGPSLYEDGNPYIVLTSYPTSLTWPTVVWNFIIKNKLQKVAILYSSHDYGTSQARLVVEHMQKAGLKPVYYEGISPDTRSYQPALTAIAASGADAVFEFGYLAEEKRFLRDLHDSGRKFKYVFTSSTGNALPDVVATLGPDLIKNTLSYAYPPAMQYDKPTIGMTTAQFMAALRKDFPEIVKTSPNSAIGGYTAGLMIETALKDAPTFGQLAFRKALADASGKVVTVSGTFEIDSAGRQTGSLLPLGQFQLVNSPEKVDMKVIFPENLSNSKILQ